MRRAVPRWGLVTAAPHEFLVHLRNGNVVSARQGGTCFKLPADTVALVDTSVKRLQFTADQVTREKTGVQVTGLAVFRIVEPTIAWRMINPDEPDAHAEILREMLLGATRRLVANLSLEECLTRRKDALAAELLGEVSPVVAGRGRPDDGADRGWGIGIDTIEIQDVRVLSEEVFARLQAPYREALQLEAIRARDEVEREEARLSHAAVEVAERRRRELLDLEESRLQADRRRALEQDTHAADLQRRQQEAKLAREREKQAHEVELHRVRVEGQLSARAREAETEREVQAANAASEAEVAELKAQAERTLGVARAEMEKLGRAARDVISEDRLRELLVTETLPEVARAYADSFDKIVVTGASDLSVLGQGVAQVLATAQALGVRVPGARDQ